VPLAYVARHGETDWNREGRYQGQLESTLTQLGRTQAVALASALARSGARRVISSPLARCVQTAEPVAAALGVEVESDARLLEIAHGTWEGRLRAEIEHADAGRMRAWMQEPASVRFDGGESLDDVAARWLAFTSSLRGNNEDVVIVTHDVLVRIAVLLAAGRPLTMLWEPRVQNGGYALLSAASQRWKVVEECCDEHLEGIRADTARQAL
jgi:broad specificity phosphatase PhoE